MDPYLRQAIMDELTGSGKRRTINEAILMRNRSGRIVNRKRHTAGVGNSWAVALKKAHAELGTKGLPLKKGASFKSTPLYKAALKYHTPAVRAPRKRAPRKAKM